MNSVSRDHTARSASGSTSDTMPSGDATPPHSTATRALHLVLLLTVLHQLIGSQFMERPFPGDPASWVFDVHQYAGLASLAVVGGFWAWTFARRGETRLERLLPWFSAGHRRMVVADLADQLGRLLRGRAPDDRDGALASATHGLGLLAVTGMVLTGTLYFVADGTQAAHYALLAHKLLANAMWAYLVAHAGVALLHEALGGRVLRRMFGTGRRHNGDQASPRAAAE